MNPIFVGILSYFFLKEKLTKNILSGVLLSIFGTFVLTFSSLGEGIFTAKGDMPVLGNILALIGAVMASFYIIIGSKIREKRDLITYITIVYTVAAIILIILSILAGLSFTGYKFSSYIYMILLAAIPQMIGHTSYNWALKYLKSSMVAITTIGEPIGATILAYIIFDETLNLLQISGILIIFFAIWLASKKSFKS
jgi:drug/metabolite transporter (DMT)-like permease